jgi:hypothetical protein
MDKDYLYRQGRKEREECRVRFTNEKSFFFASIASFVVKVLFIGFKQTNA